MEKVLFSFEMKGADSKAIREYSIPGIVLMENAGRKTFEVIHEKFAGTGKRALVVCGIGNNGGDGYVVARHMFNNGYDVIVVVTGKREDVKGDALANLEIIEKIGLEIVHVNSGEEFKCLLQGMEFGIIVDAIFGIGIDRMVKGKIKQMIEYINEYEGKEYVLSVDIPSGINADTGFAMGCAVKADDTVTFAAYKPAHIINEGISCSGKVIKADISIPAKVIEGLGSHILDMEYISGILKRRNKDSHKGTYGKVGIVAGSRNMPGAALLCSKSAMRSGSGIINLYVDYNTFGAVSGRIPEVITIESDFSDANFMFENAKGLDALLVGPGLSQDEGRAQLVQKLVKAEVPMVIDADGLNVIRGGLEILKGSKAVITPHIGEMARLVGRDPGHVLENGISVAKEFAREYGVVVVLKGSSTIIASPEGNTYICCNPNPGMASAGSGDVLSGIIASMLGQGYSLLNSALLGVFIHNQAGSHALSGFGEYSMTASDIIDMIPKSIMDILEAGDCL